MNASRKPSKKIVLLYNDRDRSNIEQGAVSTEIWLRGAQYGRLVVHLSGGLEVPGSLRRWTSVNHDGTVQGATALAQAIARRFGWEDGAT